MVKALHRFIQLSRPIALGAIALLVALPYAQAQQVQAKLDTNAIRLGEQTQLELSVNVPLGTVVTFPETGNFLVIKELEVLERATDSLISGNRKTVRQRLTLTSFDSGYHAVPPLYVQVFDPATGSVDSMATQALLLEVQTVALDTADLIRPKRDIYQTPLTFEEIWPWIASGLLLVAFGLLMWWFWKSRKTKPKVMPETKVPSIPAHITALQALDALAEKQLWQNNQTKAYHTELTEILRTYIEVRFSYPALEQTSDEVIQHFRIHREIPDAHIEMLSGILRSADLVKFAKYLPLAEENEQSLERVKLFVEQTKQAEKETADKTVSAS